jgi:polysaccharide export outer membrane protein
LLCGGAAHSEPSKLAPDTKIEVAIVQWNPSTGTYEQWAALGGTFPIAADGMVYLPVIGPLRAGGHRESEVAAAIASALQRKAGLLSTPEVIVRVVEYPPFYIVGAVEAPGAYQSRPGLTVLQALALGGGQLRAETEAVGENRFTLMGELAVLRADILRLLGRIARLEAESAGNPEIGFPPEVLGNSDRKLVSEVTALESTIFAARNSELTSKLLALSELRDLYDDEVAVLGAKNEATDHAIAQVGAELEGVTGLVSRGLATVSRRSELERELALMLVDRLGGDNAITGVRQKLSEAQRQEDGLRDERRTAIATELSDARASLDRMRTRESTLLRLTGHDPAAGSEQAPGVRDLLFTIVRQGSSGSLQFAASESTPVEPGDVLKIDVRAPESTGGQHPPDSLEGAGPLSDQRNGSTARDVRALASGPAGSS